jgi:hypothetical protein
VPVVDENDETILIYAPYAGDLVAYRNAVLSIPMGLTARALAFVNASRTFGKATRRQAVKREGCRDAVLASEMPEAHDVLLDGAEACKQQLTHYLPGQVEHDQQVLDNEVGPEWRMYPEALWTSGVINYSSQLPYHKDRNNFDAWSAMPVIRRGVRGGFLHIPAYGICVSCQDGMVVYFPGYKLTHGVTPMRKVAKDGYRYSIVYYALKGMKDCHTAAVEMAEARKRRIAREEAMAEKAKQSGIGTD